MSPVVALAVGDPRHGVVRHAVSLAAAAGWPVVSRVDDVPSGAWVVHDVTDRLWGRTADRSGPAVAAALDALRARGCRAVAALHDVPFVGDGAVFARRAEVYRMIVQRSAGVFVCSEVERQRLVELAPDSPPTAVVPVPVPPARGVPAGAPRRRPASVTVLGWIYPGKGHAEVLAGMSGLPPTVPLVCAGAVSEGHEDLLDELHATGRPVEVTGFVADEDLPILLQDATVPVAPNRVVTASASIATWWEHGRRPLVPDLAYTREVADDATVAFYDDDLGRAITAAFAGEPEATWLAPGVEPGPSLAEVAATRVAWVARWAG